MARRKLRDQRTWKIQAIVWVVARMPEQGHPRFSAARNLDRVYGGPKLAQISAVSGLGQLGPHQTDAQIAEEQR